MGLVRIHCQRIHQQSWTGDKSALYQSLKVETFFGGATLQKYLLVDLGGDEKELDSD